MRHQSPVPAIEKFKNLAVRFAALIALCCAAILVAVPAGASPIFLSAIANVTCQPAPTTDNSGQVMGQSVANANASCNHGGQVASATSRSMFGDLGVLVSASSTAFADGVSAQGIAEFEDSITFMPMDPTQLGAPIDVTVSMIVEGTTTLTGIPSGGGPDGNLTLITELDGTSNVYKELDQIGKPVQVTGSKTFTLHTTAGATMAFLAIADITTRSTDEDVASSGKMDYLDTASFIVTSDTPDVSIVSASGHDYSGATATTPEPSVMVLLVSGLAPLVWIGARRRKLGLPWYA
ncbi:MAG TPA: PEP-CTERM sorting domain-containing protein [Terriglobales bacterium]|jgi:hypothetical protein|nr:PEP-CTERM sorting domain-containing protein [Terriglobales bacterium]